MPIQCQNSSPIPWQAVQLASLVAIGFIPFCPLPLISHKSAADAVVDASSRQQHTWYPTDYRAWNLTSAWQPRTNPVFWDRPSCPANQTCLSLNVLTRDDCDVLSVSATLVDPSTGQTLLAHNQRSGVVAGQENPLILRWNLPPSRFNPTLALEAKLKNNIETLAEHRLNPTLQQLAVAQVRSRLVPEAPDWRAVNIREIRCL